MTSEHIETVKLSNWLRQNDYMYSKIPSETYTKSWNQKRKNKLEWVHKWIPDMMVVLKRNSLLFIELKKEKWVKWWMNWSKIWEEQKIWIETLSRIDNVDAWICHWAAEAINLINLMENK